MVKVCQGKVVTAVKSLMLSVLIGLATGLAVGLLQSFTSPEPIPWQVLAHWVIAGAYLALLGWLGCVVVRLVARPTSAEDRGRSSASPFGSPEVDRPHQPAPFAKRMARYLGCEEAEFHKPRPRPRSRMPFWSQVEFDTWVGPKSTSFIYFIRRNVAC